MGSCVSGKRTADKWECRTPKRTRISRWDEGDLALREAHPLCHHQDILITQIFTKLDWEGQAAVQMVCKQWRRWAKLRYRLPYHYPQGCYRAWLREWVIMDIIDNDGRDFHAWMDKDMTVYFDGFPLLFKEEE
ncbi:uncharacterized protein [Spinacia oleracea]|uniref:Uncharacterized protein LOC110786308 n=1 Tax=Spinacia oleracea TaxID=3562 RepID=A0A9R0JD52_SPIOL|nr:uncharacterized protein LOC110786308 [Spinacia oleracea]XP_021848222.2 uncharacterized protein LOC110787891 [Spinacia oleracea]XP_021849183.1 uncharacterized protein LOC110788854 [Spinacia oleracea]XP_021852045.1 uncharacterized protein LOC110791598 [Spinacia oleracea]XP_056683812.1 uncharacterized protein LOC110784785 [Spinacia oleracea]XP_056689658.1 uncharacterized protein LOC130464215 [Spinacia oleracea]XP_056690752.1 uncharacterized protein LOC130466026 [Spinacia oleracea]XP_05669350